MKKYFVTAIFTFCCLFLKADDSLSVMGNAELLKKIKKEYNPHSYLTYFQECEKRKYPPETTVKLYRGTSDVYSFLQEYQKAKIYYQKSYDISQKLNLKNFLPYITLDLAGAEYRLENYEAAEKYFSEFKPLADKLPESMPKITSLADYYFLYYLNGDFEKYDTEMAQCYVRMLAQKKRNKDSALNVSFDIVEILFLCTLGSNALLIPDEKKAAAYFGKMATLFVQKEKSLEAVKNSYQYGVYYLAKARYALYKNNFSQVQKYIFQLRQFAEENQFKDYFYVSLVLEATAKYRQQKFPEAYHAAVLALKRKTPTLDFFNYDLEAYRYAYLSAKALNKTDEALHYSQLFIEKSDKVLNEKKNKVLARILTQEENILISGRLSRVKSINGKLWFGLILTSLAILGLVFIYFRRNRIYKNKYRQFLQATEKAPDTQKCEESQTLQEQRQPPKNKSNGKLNEKSGAILKQLRDFEKSGEFNNREINLTFLASRTCTNTATLSVIINQYKGCNFNDYINGLRIDYIIAKLKSNKEYRSYKISYLAEKCGFSSHTLFSIAFKKRTGVPPSQFIGFLKDNFN